MFFLLSKLKPIKTLFSRANSFIHTIVDVSRYPINTLDGVSGQQLVESVRTEVSGWIIFMKVFFRLQL